MSILDFFYRRKETPGESNYELHVKREWEILFPEPDDMQDMILNSVLGVVRVFADEGHSGFSAGYTIPLIEKALRFEPFSPLEGTEDEWVKVGKGMFQNIRCSHVFKDADGRAYDIDAIIYEDPDGVRFTRGDPRNYIEFPYVPKTEIVLVDEDGDEILDLDARDIMELDEFRQEEPKMTDNELKYIPTNKDAPAFIAARVDRLVSIRDELNEIVGKYDGALQLIPPPGFPDGEPTEEFTANFNFYVDGYTLTATGIIGQVKVTRYDGATTTIKSKSLTDFLDRRLDPDTSSPEPEPGDGN